MLFAHKLIDALKDTKHPIGRSKVVLDFLATHLPNAEMFDFGEMPLEPISDEPGTFTVPTLTRDEKEFWREGLIPLPAPAVWYEFVLNGFRSGMLIVEEGTKWRCSRVDLVNKEFGSIDIITSIDRDRCFKNPTQEYTLEFHGNTALINKMNEDQNWGTKHFGMPMLLGMYMTLMLNSRTTDLTTEIPPPKLNKARLKRGQTPLFAHRIVDIAPMRFRDYSNVQTGSHQSPRLHWRRSHKRHFIERPATGLAKWMETEEWKGRTGWWVTVIARMLVSRLEIGIVTHEYRVRTK